MKRDETMAIVIAGLTFIVGFLLGILVMLNR
jgi:hypothetical protein